MKIFARWAGSRPEGVEHQAATLVKPDDVRALIRELVGPSAGEAHLVHEGRFLEFSDLRGQNEFDHQIVIGGWQGLGYLEFLGAGRYVQRAGEPATPEWYTANSNHFRAGTGVALATLEAAVIEFRHTTALPTAVARRDLD